MSEIKRLPALMFSVPDKTLEELSLSKYEIFNNEPLHDDSKHLKNLYFERPLHFKRKKQPESIIHHSKIKLQETHLITERVCYMSETTNSLKTNCHIALPVY